MSSHPSPLHDDDSTVRLVHIVLLIANGWLFFHLFTTHATLNGTNPASISDFKQWRNLYYTGYAVALFLIGLIRLSGRKGYATSILKPLITHLILTTFSYAIVGLIEDFLFVTSRFLFRN